MNTPAWHLMLTIAPVVGLAAYCVAQILVARIIPAENPYASLSLGFVTGFVSASCVTAIALCRLAPNPADTAGLALTNIMTYLALAFGYFNFVNLTVASLRIRLLEEIQRAGGSLERSQLLHLYSSDSVTCLRLARLVRGGHLVERDGRLLIGKTRFLAVARVFDALRWLILGRQ